MKQVGSVRLQLCITRKVILHLNIAEECQTLTPNEHQTHNELKVKCLGLAFLSRTVVRL